MEENRKYWVALNLVLAENLRAAKKIADHFPGIQDAFEASSNDLKALGIDENTARAVTSSQIVDRASIEIERLHKKNCRILTLEDEEYPEYLREIFDPPFVLYCAGKVETLHRPAVSIVGTRRASPYGKAVTQRLAAELASRGVVVVSGMARGIDSAAHQGALKKGETVAVLGSGLENIYPRENRSLYERIVEKGAVITEFPPQSPPLGFHFPIRNRIISGLCLALVVVEAARRSGSLISARLALEQNREVMAVPGNVTSRVSQGTNWLIQSGAKLVEDWEDVAEELPSPLKEELLSQKEEKRPELPPLNDRERRIYQFLKPDSAVHIDELVEKSDFSVSEVLSILLSLELKDLVSQSPGKYFQRRW
ncbi:MAG: DNA-processing protein DprA [Candidatus Aminicenantes bacterium]